MLFGHPYRRLATAPVITLTCMAISENHPRTGVPMTTKKTGNRPKQLLTKLEFKLEAGIFAARWILVPAYLVLVLTVAVLTYKTCEEFVQLVLHLQLFNESQAILQALTIVDMVLVLNLLLMVLFVGYINFISKIHTDKQEDWPDWMNHLGYSGLKVQLLGSVIAVATIQLLRTFIELSNAANANFERLVWQVVIYVVFVVAVFLIATVNWINRRNTDVIAKSNHRSRASVTSSEAESVADEL